MMRHVFIILFALLAAFAMPSTSALAGDPVFNFDDEDPEMNAAITEARRTLPRFYAKAEQTGLETEAFSVKIAIPYGSDGNEHIWATVIERDGDAFTGILDNAPVHIDMSQGQRVQFVEGNISDWMYWESGQLHGSYTTRVMLPRLSKQQAAELRAILAPLPEG